MVVLRPESHTRYQETHEAPEKFQWQRLQVLVSESLHTTSIATMTRRLRLLR